MAGELPYHGAFDHKPIALYYVFAAFFSAFGYSLAALLIPLAAAALTSWPLFTGSRESACQRTPFPCLERHPVWRTVCSSFGNGGHASNTEIIQMPAIAAWWMVALNWPESKCWRAFMLASAVAGVVAQINYLGGFVVALSTAAFSLAWPLFSGASFAALRAFLVRGFLALGAFALVALLMLAPLIVADDLSQAPPPASWLSRRLSRISECQMAQGHPVDRDFCRLFCRADRVYRPGRAVVAEHRPRGGGAVEKTGQGLP